MTYLTKDLCINNTDSTAGGAVLHDKYEIKNIHLAHFDHEHWHHEVSYIATVKRAISLLMHRFQCNNLKAICSVISGNWVEPVNDSITWPMAGRKYMTANISTGIYYRDIL